MLEPLCFAYLTVNRLFPLCISNFNKCYTVTVVLYKDCQASAEADETQSHLESVAVLEALDLAR